MGKVKGRGDEHACRINYLFQAGQTVAECSPELSQYYGQVLTVITEKTAPKKDFTMKRSMCKKCHAVLKVGENATYRLRKNKHRKGSPVMVIGCKLCGERKRIPTSKRDYQIKAERDGKISGGSSSSNTTPPNGAISDSNDKKPNTDQLENPTTSSTSCEAANVESDSPEPETSTSIKDESLETIASTPPVVVATATEVDKMEEHAIIQENTFLSKNE